jgi:hypothetical protein
MSEAAVIEIDPLRSRSFSLGDAMILILALALGLGLARPYITLIANYCQWTRILTRLVNPNCYES